MTEKERLDQALRELRNAEAGTGAPPSVEARLRAAYRQKHARSAWRWVPAVAASVIVGFFAWQAASVPIPAPPTPPTAPAVAVVPTPKRLVAEVRPSARPSRRPPKARPSPVNQTTLEFAALPFAPPVDPSEPAQVIRVTVPRQSIRALGFPVNEERMGEGIPADLLIGQDGIARGIRFINAAVAR